MTHPSKLITSRVLVALACLTIAAPVSAEMQTTLNMSGQAGLIDMPSGDQLPDGYLTLDHSRFGPIVRNSVRFQLTPRFSGTFRYVAIHDWNSVYNCTSHPRGCTDADLFSTYYDRNFDISYQILTESRYFPAVTVGLQDFVGTGLDAAEYIAATKTFDQRLKVTAGIGFGRLGSYNPLGDPLGPRAPVIVGQGGNFNVKQWFHGNAAGFGGVEYKFNDKLTLKAEYSSDAYVVEAGQRKTFDRRSPFNFGMEYQVNPSIRIGGYYMYGSQIGGTLTFYINPDQRPIGGIGGPGPEPVKVRPSPVADPAAWTTGWTQVANAQDILMSTLKANLVGTGVSIESLGFTANTAQVRFRNDNYEAAAQAVGRVARAMSQAMPASVEVFEIVPIDHGLPASKVVIQRSDLELLEFAPDAGDALRAKASILEAGQPLPGTMRNPELYPRLTWSAVLYDRTVLFSPSNPLQAALGLRVTGTYELAPGFILSGSLVKPVLSNIQAEPHNSSRPLPPVRRDSSIYATAQSELESLTAAWYTRLAPNVFGRVTAGYLEEMFGGISTEVMWRPVNSRLALGAEVNYVAQRNTDGGFGFNQYNYRVLNGHLSGYYDFKNGFFVEVDAGRYLAGDVGATLTIAREFTNGWQIGAFATRTNVSAKDFGEGSFDKGIYLTIPISWLSGTPTRLTRTVVLRPIGGDGGARLDVNGRLYDVLRSYDQTRLDDQWGRVWK